MPPPRVAVFIKPHAVTEPVEALVKERLAANGIEILGEGRLEAQEIDERLLIDTHYGAIAKRAVVQQPHELNVPEKAQAEFEKTYGLTWASALEQKLVFNANGAAERLGVDANGLEGVWRTLKKGETLIKFGGGFYCAKLSDDAGEFYAINGFYLQMRSVFTTPPAAIKWFSVQWPAAALSWGDFRGKVLGATDPSTAPEGAIRRMILDGWKDLGLDSEPNTGNNGVHASASPIEGLFERMNWLSADPTADVYGAELVAAGIPVETIKEWSTDPAVPFEGSLQSLFDLHEDMDAPDCTARAVAVLAESEAAKSK